MANDMRPLIATHDESLDLMLQRTVPVRRELVWRAWTEPEQLMKWFCPRPWKVVRCEIDLRPGGRFFTVMQSPEGQEYPGEGCYLEVVPGERLVWTDAMSAGFRPNAQSMMTGVLTLADAPDGGTVYTARAIHATPEVRQQHADMGFDGGWSTALDQLVEHVQSL